MQARSPLQLVLVALPIVFGCAPAQRNVQQRWLPTYAFGMIGGGDLDVRDVCASGRASELSVGTSWATLGISIATLGVYTPRQARVRCVPPR